MPSTGTSSAELLREIARHDVDAIVVGALAAVLQGAPLMTFDIDIVHSRAPDNVARLLVLLEEIDAVYRHDPRDLRPTASHLAGPGHHLLCTRLGSLDCLGTIGPVGHELAYSDLLPSSVEIELGDGLRGRVLGLEKVIEMKRAAGRPKDIAALPVLIATLDEIEKRGR